MLLTAMLVTLFDIIVSITILDLLAVVTLQLALAVSAAQKVSIRFTAIMNNEQTSTEGKGHAEALLLPAPDPNDTQTLEVNGGSIRFDLLGPMVVNSNGVSFLAFSIRAIILTDFVVLYNPPLDIVTDIELG